LSSGSTLDQVEFDEAGILGDRNPLFAIRKYSAPRLAELRREAFEKYDGLQGLGAANMRKQQAPDLF